MIEYTSSTELDGVLVIQNKVHHDNRGCFLENYSEDVFNNALYNSGLNTPPKFVQDNISLSLCKNVIRGLHYQLKYPQAKLISVLQGSIIDVIVDIRKDSPTFGKYIKVCLSAFDGKSVFIPVGFAHGFRTLQTNNIVNYKTTDIYHTEDAYTIAWNDKTCNIDWCLNSTKEVIEEIQKTLVISDKDKEGTALSGIDPKYLPNY